MPEINGDVTCVPLADYWANHFKSFLFNGICPCFPQKCPVALVHVHLVVIFLSKM